MSFEIGQHVELVKEWDGTQQIVTAAENRDGKACVEVAGEWYFADTGSAQNGSVEAYITMHHAKE